MTSEDLRAIAARLGVVIVTDTQVIAPERIELEASAIGRCDLCGPVDHHLREGVCHACRSKFALDTEEDGHV